MLIHTCLSKKTQKCLRRASWSSWTLSICQPWPPQNRLKETCSGRSLRTRKFPWPKYPNLNNKTTSKARWSSCSLKAPNRSTTRARSFSPITRDQRLELTWRTTREPFLLNYPAMITKWLISIAQTFNKRCKLRMRGRPAYASSLIK